MMKLNVGEWYLTPDNLCLLLSPAPTGTGTITLDPTFGSFTLLEPLSHKVNPFLWWKCFDDLDWNTLNKNRNEFQEAIDPMQMALYKMIMRKQLRTCGNKCNHKTSQNQCKYGFPFNAHLEHCPKFNNYTNHWEYYRPRHEDYNVVPYHASLLLLWGVQLNIQRIISSYWSYYLLKYAMKCEPHGTINLNKKIRTITFKGRIRHTNTIHFFFYYQQTCLEIPMVKKSKVVQYIDSKPPQPCTKLITKSRVLGFHPIDVYTNRPSQFENMTFIQYFTKFEYDKMQHPSLQHYHNQNNLRNYIFTTNTLTRFTNFHPTHNTQTFFYNVLLQKITFWNEIELSPTSNLENVKECHIHDLLLETPSKHSWWNMHIEPFENPHGLHILTSIPKSGKAFFVKYITQHFHMHDKNVLLSTTTGSATLFLSISTIITHTAFGIPTCGCLLVLLEPHNVKENSNPQMSSSLMKCQWWPITCYALLNNIWTTRNACWKYVSSFSKQIDIISWWSSSTTSNL